MSSSSSCCWPTFNPSLHRSGVSQSFQGRGGQGVVFSRANIDTRFVVFDKTVVRQKKPSQAMRYTLGKGDKRDISERKKKKLEKELEEKEKKTA